MSICYPTQVGLSHGENKRPWRVHICSNRRKQCLAGRWRTCNEPGITDIGWFQLAGKSASSSSVSLGGLLRSVGSLDILYDGWMKGQNCAFSASSFLVPFRSGPLLHSEPVL